MMARNTVVGVFEFSDDAQRAIEALREAGFRSDDIGVTMRDAREAQVLAEDSGASAGAGAATGALAGGALGGLAGWLVGIGALAIPGVGPIVAAGPLAAALTGAAVGAAGGGLLGALTGMGVPEEEARWYESEVGRGGTLVTVRADGRYDEARGILKEHGAREAGSDGAGATDSSATRPRAATTTVDRGHDTEASRTVIRPRSETSYESPGRTTAFDTDHVAEARVEATSDSVAGVAAGGAHEAPPQGVGNWADVAPEFRSDWERRYGTSGRTWEQAEPAYRYGWESAHHERYRGREWSEVEADLDRDWSDRYGRHGAWGDARENAREAWERARNRR